MLSGRLVTLVPLLLLASDARAEAQSDENQFSAAAGAFISSYIEIPLISAPVAAAASAASVTGDVASLITSALEATPVPAWFYGAIPAQYKSNIDAAISDIAALRAAASAGATPTGVLTIATRSAPPTVEQTTIVSTGTDSEGHTFTTSIVSAVSAPATVTSTSGSGSASSSASGSGSTSASSSTSGNAAPAATGQAGRAAAGAAALIGLMAAL